MTADQFAYWVQGVFEGKTSLTSEQQIQLIKDHLALVMTKVTPVIQPLGSTDYWNIPRNPLQDLPTYVQPNPSTVGPLCSRGPIINNCTTGGITTTTADTKHSDTTFLVPPPQAGYHIIPTNGITSITTISPFSQDVIKLMNSFPPKLGFIC